MPRKKVTRHGTLDGQQTKVEKYKQKGSYQKLKEKTDQLSKQIKDLFENNVWDLKEKFEHFKLYLEELGNKGEIAWFNGIQYLDYVRFPKPLNVISLQKLIDGEYIGMYIDKKDKILPKTDEKYGKRVKFWMKTFLPMKKQRNIDNLQWIIKQNREIMYEIMKYHHEKGNALSTLNSDFKTLVRVIKLLLGDEDELRLKYSALQVGLTDLENIKDDQNQVSSNQEFAQYVPYEDLTTKVEDMYKKYFQSLKQQTKDKNELFNDHQDLLALALYVWDYPSRQEKLTLDFITQENQAQPNKNYVLIPPNDDGVCKFIFNEIKKDHRPISYDLKTSVPVLSAFNNNLNELLIHSYRTYPRTPLFISKKGWYRQNLKKITPSSVSTWLRNLIGNKNLGIDGFRSSFVTYYLPKMNNAAKKIMSVRMRTSVDIIHRSYFKFTNNPDILLKAKIERTEAADGKEQLEEYQRLERRAASGKPNNPIIVGQNNSSLEMPASDINLDNYDPNQFILQNNNNNNNNNNIVVPAAIPILSKKERNRLNFKKWYQKSEKNQTKHKERVNKNNTDLTYAKRMVRELNNKKIDYKVIKETTLEKYKIKKNDEGEYYTDLK